MNLFLILQANLLPILVAFAVLLLIWKRLGNRTWSNYGRLPPGPKPAPVVGNFFQIYVKEPYKYYLELSQKYGPVFTIWFANTPVVVISGYQALKDSMIGMGEEFSGRFNYPLLMKSTNGYGVLVSNGNRWKQLRKFSLVTMKNFGMGRRSFEDKVKEEACCLVQTFSTFGDSAFCPKDLLHGTVCNVICSFVFGHRFESADPQFMMIRESIEAYFSVLSSSLGQAYNIFPRLVGLFPGRLHDMFKRLERVNDFVREEAYARSKTLDLTSPPQDFLEAFLIQIKVEKHNPNTEFTFDNMLSTAWSLFSAGTETTSSTLRQALLLMSKHPDVQARVQKEIDEVVGPDQWPSLGDRQNMPYTDAVIHEVQRSMDIAPTSVPHKMLNDTEFNNYLIPKGTVILPLLSSVLSDPKQWKNPGHFDPNNFLDEKGKFKKNDAFVVFGIGKRACLGEALARVELFIFFTFLLQRFTFKATQPLEELDVNPSTCSFGRVPRSYKCFAVRRA